MQFGGDALPFGFLRSNQAARERLLRRLLALHRALTPPPGGFNLDALVIDGRVTPDAMVAELGLTVARGDADKESRLVGAVKGGGPTITVRSTRGDLALQSRDVQKADDEKPKDDKAR